MAARGALALGAVVPLARRRLPLPAPLVSAIGATAPFALCVLVPRSRLRDLGVLLLQTNAYVATYQMPHDDPGRLRARVRVRYPVVVDRAIGLGRLPGARLQDALAVPGRIRAGDRVLVWCHWLWFLVPQGTAAYLLLRRREQFAAGALQIYATFDLGLIGYWALPTAPPWYAAQTGAMGEEGVRLRRMMYEHGEEFWGRTWAPLYSFLGGNPLAAMPSLHFATSVMAAHVLGDAGGRVGGLAGCYALTLGFALVYLGEHYVIDLVAGLALAETVRRGGPRALPLLRAVSRSVQRLEAQARA